MSDIREGHDKSVSDEELQQIVEQLKAAEKDLPFVGLDWFRNEFLPQCDHPWAKDPDRNRLLLQRAVEECLILILRVPNPDRPSNPIKAIMAIPARDQFRSSTEKHGLKFTPIKIKGGPISDTVIEDRADRS